MPNWQNILSPINVHGIGRSGTTLLQNIIGTCKSVQICNETVNLLFGCYRAGELLLHSDDKIVPGLPGEVAVAVNTVHAAFCAAMPSDKPAWCQKIGGIPNSVVWSMITDEDREYASEPYPFPYRWYWKALSQSFPFSRDILIIRPWQDILVSRWKFSKYRPEEIAADIAVYLNMMAHSESRIGEIIEYPRLVSEPSRELIRIFSKLGLEVPPEAECAFQWHAAPAGDRSLADAATEGFSRSHEHDGLITAEIEKTLQPALRRMRGRFGDRLDLG